MDTFLETQNIPRINQEELENLNRFRTIKDVESVIKSLPTKKIHGPGDLTGGFQQTVKENQYQSFQTFPKKFKRKEYFHNRSMRPALPIPKTDKDIARKLQTNFPYEQ